MKPRRFSECPLPMLVTSLTDRTAGGLITTMRNATYDGADAFMIHMERMDPAERTKEQLARIFAYACDKPVFTLNYRGPSGQDDDALFAEQVTAVEAGASLIDMMGDLFGPAPDELAHEPEVVAKQAAAIARIHAMGAEVLMSSHVWHYLSIEDVLAQARALEARGADFVKIAMTVTSEDEAFEALATTRKVSRALGVPFLHVCMGQYGKLHRAIAPLFGSCFALCVQQYTEAGHREKPLLRAEKAVLANIDAARGRDPFMGLPRVPQE